MRVIASSTATPITRMIQHHVLVIFNPERYRTQVPSESQACLRATSAIAASRVMSP